MRKLGIVTAVAGLLLAVFGVSDAAFADGHEEQLCENLPTGEDADQNAQDVFGQEHGEPFSSTFDGATESCVESNMDSGLRPSPLLCGLADGLDVRPGEEMGEEIGSATVGELNNGLAENAPDNPVVGFEACGDTDPEGCTEDCAPPPDDNSGGGDNDPGPEVRGRNQTADGGLPRTGGELFAGLGFGLAGIGALARRFLPVS